jgi:hypothetical protein
MMNERYEAASRAIPLVLANLRPDDDSMILESTVASWVVPGDAGETSANVVKALAGLSSLAAILLQTLANELGKDPEQLLQVLALQMQRSAADEA